jgi:hypothetical protein
MSLTVSYFFAQKIILFLALFSVILTGTSSTAEAKYWVEPQWDKRAKINDYTSAWAEFVKKNIPKEQTYSGDRSNGYYPIATVGNTGGINRPPNTPRWVGDQGDCFAAIIGVGWNPDGGVGGTHNWKIGFKDLQKAMNTILDTPCYNKENRTIGGWMSPPGYDDVRLLVMRDDTIHCRHEYGKLPE